MLNYFYLNPNLLYVTSMIHPSSANINVYLNYLTNFIPGYCSSLKSCVYIVSLLFISLNLSNLSNFIFISGFLTTTACLKPCYHSNSDVKHFQFFYRCYVSLKISFDYEVIVPLLRKT